MQVYNTHQMSKLATLKGHRRYSHLLWHQSSTTCRSTSACIVTTACVCHSPISLSLVQWHLTEADTQTVKKLTFGLGMQCYNCHCSCTCGSFRTEMLPCSRSSQGCHALQSCQAYVFAKIWRGAGDRFNRLHLTLGSSGDYACLLEGNCDFIIKHLLAVAAVCIQSMCKTVIDTAFSGSNVSSYAL